MKRKEAVRGLVRYLMTRLNMNGSIDDIVRSYKETDVSLTHMPVGALIEGMLFDESDTNSRDHSDLPEKARMVYYPWQDVLASMYVYPDEVHIVRATCPECGKKYVQLHFSSPSWTWRALCGRAGTMTICPSCLKQESFILEIMN